MRVRGLSSVRFGLPVQALLGSLLLVAPAKALDCEYLMQKVGAVDASCAAGDAAACEFRKNYQASVDTCATSSGLPVPGTTIPAETTPPVVDLEPDPLVVEVQTLLAAAGFDPGALDGQAGASTCRAAAAFAAQRKKAVGCDDMLALRQALRETEKDVDPLEGCAMLAQISDARYLTAWREQQAVLVGLLEDELRDLESVQRQTLDDLGQIGSTRAGLSEMVLSVRAVAKLGIGIGAVVSVLAASPAAVPLLGALALMSTAEEVDSKLREWSGREQLDGIQPELREIDTGIDRINQGLQAVTAIVEGAEGIKGVAERGKQARQAFEDLQPLLAQQRVRIEKATAKVRDGQGYLMFLNTLSEARDMCSKEVEVQLP